MADKFINRYNSYCKCVNNLQNCKTANPMDDFVIEGTVTRFNLSFDLAWKVMKDILVKKMEINDFALGSPREVMRKAYENKIIYSDEWLTMLRYRNQLTHDYDGTLAYELFDLIVNDYTNLFVEFQGVAAKYYLQDDTD